MEEQSNFIVYDEFGNQKQCKILAIIENKYIVYTNINNNNLSENIMVSKFDKLTSEINLIPLDDYEWTFVEKKYLDICNKIVNEI